MQKVRFIRPNYVFLNDKSHRHSIRIKTARPNFKRKTAEPHNTSFFITLTVRLITINCAYGEHRAINSNYRP